jgi:formylglycine-generating enzyme required for sulfatase activity
MGSDHLAEGGDWLRKLCAPIGLPWGKQPKPSNEIPVHWVEFRHGFWIARTEVTNAQYRRFDPRFGRWGRRTGDRQPAATLRWGDARRYCAWLSARVGVKVRLPTEAEWECACRAGSETEYCFGDADEDLHRYAWTKENSDRQSHRVASKLPNRWGLYDMHGNVWEWCEDTFHDFYESAPLDGAAWTSGGMRWSRGQFVRVMRGGGWTDRADRARSAHRYRYDPDICIWDVGFRPAFSNRDD